MQLHIFLDRLHAATVASILAWTYRMDAINCFMCFEHSTFHGKAALDTSDAFSLADSVVGFCSAGVGANLSVVDTLVHSVGAFFEMFGQAIPPAPSPGDLQLLGQGNLNKCASVDVSCNGADTSQLENIFCKLKTAALSNLLF